MQLWACCAAHKAAALREVLKVSMLCAFFRVQPGSGSCLLHAWRQLHTGSLCVGVMCRRCHSCPLRSRLAARARCLTSCWRRRNAIHESVKIHVVSLSCPLAEACVLAPASAWSGLLARRALVASH